MRGTTIFSLPGQLIGAALGTTELEKKHRNKSLLWRLKRQYSVWRLDYRYSRAVDDLKNGRFRVLRDEHFESLDNFLNLP